jgi:hypothetical protein
MKPDGSSFKKKHDGSWSLPDGTIEPERKSGASHRSGSPRGDRSEGQTGTNVFGGDGFRYQYPNGDQVEYTVILFECSNDGSPEQFDYEETQGLDCFAPSPPLGLAYSSISLFGLQRFDLLRAG